jgi:hypothetical protein
MTNDMKPESTLQHILNFTKIEHTAFSLPLIFTGAWLGGGKPLSLRLAVMLLIVIAAARRPYFRYGHESGIRPPHRSAEPADGQPGAAGRQDEPEARPWPLPAAACWST